MIRLIVIIILLSTLIGCRSIKEIPIRFDNHTSEGITVIAESKGWFKELNIGPGEYREIILDVPKFIKRIIITIKAWKEEE